MKFNIKKKFLAAAVCLALSTSSALAMPTGGSVQSGSIDLPNGGNLISGDTITASTNGVIDWTSFSIGNGESLTFALSGNTVLNRVTGDQLSSLLGTLDASTGNLILSNPNGILVGAGAEINAHNLMLTTLSFDNEAANIIFNDVDKIANFKNGNAAKGVEINGGTVSVAHALDVIGGTVTIADGVNITGAGSGSLPTDIHVLAANKADVSGGDAGLVSANATSANVINIGTDNNMTNLMALNNVGLYGGGININNTNIKSKNVDVFAFAVNNGSTITADTTNTVNIKDSHLQSDDIGGNNGGSMNVFGGKVDINHTELIADGTTAVRDIFVAAGSSASGSESGMNLTTDNGNDVTITNSSIRNNTYNDSGVGPIESGTKIYGSSVTVKDSEVLSNGDIELFALKSFAHNGKKLDFAASGNVNKLTVDSSAINSNQERATDRSDAVLFGGSVDIAGSSKIEAPANAGHDIFALSSAKVDDATDTFELKANANNKLTIADTVTLTGGNNGPQKNLPGVYAGSIKVGNGEADTTVGEKEITVNGKSVWAAIYNNYNEGIDIGDITEDTPVEKIHEAASKITDPKDALDILTNIASGNVNLSDEKKKQVVKAIMESSPVVSDKTQEIKNQDAASQAEGATAPLENAANAGADSDNGADSAVTVEGNTSDNNESEE